MTFKRLFQSIMMTLQKNGIHRANYLRKHHIFHHVGKNVSIQSRKIPLYPELISLHDNVHIASRVNFITHDICYKMLNANEKIDKHGFIERIGCIEIMDNVFVGAGSTILYNVRIGQNTIIAADSVITKDLEGNGVYGGCPARKIEDFNTYLKKIDNRGEIYPKELCPQKQRVSKQLEQHMWTEFEKSK